MALAPALMVASLAGLALGSYAVTAGVRFARAEPSARGRSHCDRCGETLGFLQTIPVLSYLLAKGRCRACRASIDPIHLIGEISGLVTVLAAVWVRDPARTPLLIVLGLTLVTLATVDWRIGRLPNLLVALVAAIGLALSALTSLTALATGVAAAAIALVIFQGLRMVTARTPRGPAMGLGDVKLICALALWLGALTPWMVVAAAILALVVGRIVRPPEGRLATGPMFAFAGWVIGAGVEIWHWPTTV